MRSLLRLQWCGTRVTLTWPTRCVFVPSRSAATTAATDAPAMHLDYHHLAATVEQAKRNVEARRMGHACDPELVVRLRAQWTRIQQALDAARSERKRAARDPAVGRELKHKVKRLTQLLHAIEQGVEATPSWWDMDLAASLNVEAPEAWGRGLWREAASLPNDAAVDLVPRGDAPEVLDEWWPSDELRQQVAQPEVVSRVNHVALEGAHGWDFDTARDTCGSGFVYLRGQAALAEQALVAWALAHAVRAGWEPVATPDMVRTPVLAGCGFQPRVADTQVYGVVGGGSSGDAAMSLVGTAEVPLAGLHANAVAPEHNLPARYAGVGHCFRTEAGASGRASNGLYRLHQFTKVELFAVTTGSVQQSDAVWADMLQLQGTLLRELGLAHRLVAMPAADLGASAACKVDMEAWMGSRGAGAAQWGEVSSTSRCTDYQARRLGMRWQPEAGGRPCYAHTLNGTGLAVPRIMMALVEQWQASHRPDQEASDALRDRDASQPPPWLPPCVHPFYPCFQPTP